MVIWLFWKKLSNLFDLFICLCFVEDRLPWLWILLQGVLGGNDSLRSPRICSIAREVSFFIYFYKRYHSRLQYYKIFWLTFVFSFVFRSFLRIRRLSSISCTNRVWNFPVESNTFSNVLYCLYCLIVSKFTFDIDVQWTLKHFVSFAFTYLALKWVLFDFFLLRFIFTVLFHFTEMWNVLGSPVHCFMSTTVVWRYNFKRVEYVFI